MAKTVKDIKNIDVELKKFQDKLNEFQSYLQINKIVTQVTSNDKIILSEENQDKLHNEITMQIKMQDAILAWMPLLKKLKEEDTSDADAVRGGAEVGGHFAKES